MQYNPPELVYFKNINTLIYWHIYKYNSCKYKRTNVLIPPKYVKHTYVTGKFFLNVNTAFEVLRS